MLRAQAHQDEDIDKENDSVAIVLPLSTTDDHEKKVLSWNDEEMLWSLLLAAVAECVITCYMPEYTLRNWKLNVGGTLLNWTGTFMDGLSHGYEEFLNGAEMSLACLQFRSAFLGVFTSYSFMADHAGDLSSHNFAMGPLYVCASVGGGCGCFCMGKRAATWILPFAAKAHCIIDTMTNRPSLMTSLIAFVGLTTLRAALGPHGFVRDPKEPQFIGTLQVADGEELILGIVMSCSAVLLSTYVCGFFPRQPSQLHTAASISGRTFIDWACLCCNFLASAFAGSIYQLSRISHTKLTNNLLALKFVSSFCGSLSVFSGAVSIISVHSYAVMACWQSALCSLESLLTAACGAGMYAVPLQT